MKSFLSEAEKTSLKRRHRSEKDGRTRDRIKAVLLKDKGWTCEKIAEVLLLDQETVSTHIHEYLEKEKLSIKTGGSSGKLAPDQVQELTAHLEAVTYLKVQEICAYVKTQHGITYTIAGMTSWLKNHGFSYKKPKPTPLKADPEKQAEFIQHYERLVKTRPEDEPVLFLDGVHPTMATKITYGWIKAGKDKPIFTTASRTRMNLLGALNLETMEVALKEYKTIDSKALVEYFTHLRNKYKTAPKIHVILDRSPYNTSYETKEAAARYGIFLHYLPPYSPNLNPIERLWKVMNEYVRNNRFFDSPKRFRKEIMQFFDQTWACIALSMVDRINDNFEILKKSVV